MGSEKLSPNPELPLAIIALTKHGVQLALRLQGQLLGSRCYVPLRHRFALAMGAQGFDRLGTLLSQVWTTHRALVCIMASGIVVRHIAPLLRHKTLDPAVLVLDERGQFVVSLVSGHLGGANRLANEIAALTGGQAVITTASDVQQKPALDVLAQQLGLEIENVERLSRTGRAILEDEPLVLYDPQGYVKSYLGSVPQLIPLPEEIEPGAFNAPDSAPVVWVSERLPPEGLPCLILRPRNLVVGIGCNRGTASSEILDLLQQVFERERLSRRSIRNLASVDLKADEVGLLEAGKQLDRPIEFYAREQIDTIATPNPSAVVAAHIGVFSVCEATALLSARSETLLVPKQKTINVTLAVARVALRS